MTWSASFGMAGVRTIGPKRAYDRIRLREMGAALSADRRQSQPAISKRGGSRLNGARPERRTTLEGAGPELRRARTAQGSGGAGPERRRARTTQDPNYARPELRKTQRAKAQGPNGGRPRWTRCAPRTAFAAVVVWVLRR